MLATGGVGGAAFNDLSKPARAAEIWNPATGNWRTLASSAVTRGYHATSILLPDGRVLHAGSGDGEGAPRQLNAELFSPPYLFAGPRPTITSAPGTARYGTTFRVTTPDAAAIAKVSLIRLGSVTHAFDMNQRYQTLDFTSDANGLTVTVPASRNRTPPGHYMLFIVNGVGRAVGREDRAGQVAPRQRSHPGRDRCLGTKSPLAILCDLGHQDALRCSWRVKLSGLRSALIAQCRQHRRRSADDLAAAPRGAPGFPEAPTSERVEPWKRRER